MPFNDLERIKNNQELYGDISTDDEAMILADNSLSTEEKNVAVLSPDTYKQKKKQYSVEDEMAKYPALFSNLKIPSMYAMTAAHKDELKKYEDEFYAESKKQGALANAWNSFWYSRKAMEISALDADRMDAIRDNDEVKLAEIDNKIKVAREELSRMDAPTDEDSVSGAIGAIGASLVRNLPELIASGVITTGLASLAGISGGSSLAGAAVSGGRFVNALSKIRGGYNAVRAAKAMKFANVSNEVIGMGIIYNDTANVERGAAYRELSEQHPEMSEEERQEKAWLIGRVNGGIEAATAGAFGLAARGFATVARPAQRALARKLLTNETATTALKNATYDAIDAGILDAAKATDSRFISKLAGNLKAVLENPKVALGKEVIDYSMEGYTEIFQDTINKTVAEWDESEQGDLTAGSALGDAWSRVNEGFVELYNYVVNDGTLSDETRQMFRKFGSIGVASALFGRTGHYVGEAFNRIGRDKVSNPATQLEAANTTISKLDRVLEQKKNSALYGKSPEAANEFYNNVAKSGNLPKTISIDENKLKELIEESKSDPVIQAQIARANLGEKLKTAEAGMVEMEFQEFNQAFLDPNNDTLYQKIKNDITENPAMMTKNEVIGWLGAIMESDANIAEAEKDKNSLYNRVYEMSKKNGAEDALAATQAVVAQYAFSTIGRFGLSPKDAEKVAQEIGFRMEVEQHPEGILSRLTKKVKEAFTGKSGFVTDQSKAYARMIFEDELAALNKKKQAKLKEGKDVVQEETRVKELEAMLGDEGEIKTTEAQENFIRAIEAKDIDTLADIISKNRQAKKFFESLEGVKLPSTKSGIAETLGNWARVDVAGEILKQDLSGIAGSTTFTPTETILRLSKISNPTTFIHEVGHIFIKQLLDMYNKGQLNPVWQKKAEDFIEFCGFEKDERGVIMAGEKYVAAQEKFADAMMTYFWEGKAPKPYLKAMFDAIAEWFADFYNMMKMSPLGLTPKVREAFDAIFTPYEEQQQVQAEKKLGFLPKPDGMSDAQYQQYIAEKRALTSYSATEEIRAAAKVAKLKTEKAYQEEYEASLNEAYQDLGKLPVYQMIEDIQVNKILAGTLNLPKGMALRKEFVSSQKGAAVQEVLAMYKNLVSTEEELVRILNETPSRSATAQYIAEKHMNEWLRENYPTTENLNAEFAEKNERAVRLATMEYMMLAGIDMKNFSLEYNSILAAGEELVQTMPMNKAVNVERWLEMENKILQKYEYAKTDKERAQLKRLQAVISFYAMRSKDIRTDYRKFSKKVRKYRKDPDSSGLRQMAGATWDLLKTILYNYNFTQSKPRSKETLLEKMTNLQMALLNEGFTSADVLDNYKYSLPQDKIDHKIEYGEFSKMTEIFSLVEGMGYAQKQVVVNGKRINIENAADDLIDYMQRENIKPVNERSAIGKGLDNWMIPEALLKEILPQKVYLDYIAPHMKGIAERDNQIRTWQNRQAELLKLYNGDYTEKVEIGGRAYTILDLLVIMLNSGNNHNFNCMVKTLQKKFGDLNYSAEDMMAALNAAPKELRAITRGIWQIFEENKEAFQEVQNQIDGKVIKFVDPDAYTFDDGEVMEGGYYPAGTVAQIKDFADTQSAFRVDGVYASQSFQHDRKAGVHGDLDLTLNSLTAWNYKMASVLHVAVPYNNLGKLLRNERVAIALGEYRVRWLNEWMKMSTAPLKVSPFLAAVDGLASVKILGWAPARAFTQMSGIFPAMQQIGTKWVMKAIAQMGSPMHAIKKASTLSPYMQARYANPEEHLNLLLQSRQMFGVNVKQKLKKGFEYYTDVAMFSVIYGDAIASYTTWTAEFEKQKAAGLSDQDASALADSQVRLLQGDMSAGSRPKGMQGNMRFFTKFASYFIGISSLLRAKAARGTAWNIIAREAGLLTSVCLFGAAWESLWKTMTQWLWAEVTDDDDQKKKWAKKGINSPEDLFLSLAAENAASTFGSATVPMYGIGNAAMTALTTGNLYDAKNLQLDWMYNFLGVAQIANSFFVDDEEKAVRVRKKGLKNILSSAMTDSAANKVTNILIGE